MLLAVLMLVTCLTIDAPEVEALKLQESRAIAIVFDNSGSMYKNGNQAWCRATYAMEVFASMLNKGDVLQIYPMWPITVGNQEYTMEKPFQITDSAQASTIRQIYTDKASGTPIESIDCAAEGLKNLSADKKYMIVLTDGGKFSIDGKELSTSKTITELDNRVRKYSGPAMTVMYLGIGEDASMPSVAESDYFKKEKASDTADVLSTLTVMCNQVFGRDTLPKNHISGKTIDFDISMSKLIVFVQGENISNLKVTGGTVGKKIGEQQTKYSEAGAGNYTSKPDTSLQGMIVTYENCGSGRYTIEHSGTATSVEVYYEPDADLDFVFTDADGNVVDPNALYEGEYKVSFGMKDAKTGKLITSDLLGKPKYNGHYYINGKEYPITHEGSSGSVDIPLKMGDTFKADLNVTFLSGYTISKDSSDFGWPDGGIEIIPRPAGELDLKITGGDEIYYLNELDVGTPYKATATYKGKQLNADAFKLTVSDNTGNAEFELVPNGDHYKVILKHKNPSSPDSTKVGEFKATFTATYAEAGSAEAKDTQAVQYRIDAVRPAGKLKLEISGGQASYSIKTLENGKKFVAKVYYEGTLLTGDALKLVELKWDSDLTNAAITCEFAEDHYLLSLHYKDPASPKDTVCGDCTVPITAYYTEPGSDQSQARSSIKYTIKEDSSKLTIDLSILDDYIVIAELEESREIVVSLAINGNPLTAEEFAATKLKVDCGGIKYTLTPYPEDSAYRIKLLSTEGIEEGRYSIGATAQYTDSIGRTFKTESSKKITLSVMPLWLKWVLSLLFLLILFIVIWIILHIRVCPKYLHTSRRDSRMNYDMDDVTQNTNFRAELKQNSVKVQSQYGGSKFGIIMNVKPGKESYLYKSQKNRTAEVKVLTVRKFGAGKIQEVLIGSVKYVLDDATGKLAPAMPNQKPFLLTNGIRVKFTGVVQDGGIDRDFEVASKLNFKKK